MLNHVNDGERVFSGRVFWFARGFTDALPIRQEIAVQMAHANNTSWAASGGRVQNRATWDDLVTQNSAGRGMGADGCSGDNPVSVRALAYIIAGHVTHHMNVLREKYL